MWGIVWGTKTNKKTAYEGHILVSGQYIGYHIYD